MQSRIDDMLNMHVKMQLRLRSLLATITLKTNFFLHGDVLHTSATLHDATTYKASMAVENLTYKPFNMTNLLDSHPEMATDPSLIPRGAVVVYANQKSTPNTRSKKNAANEIAEQMKTAVANNDEVEIKHLQRLQDLNSNYDAGHIEIKDDDQHYYSDFTDRHSFIYSPFNNSHNKDYIIGVLIPSN